GEDFWWFFSADKSEAIEFFPNLPKESFKLTPKVFSSLVAYSRIVSGDILQVQIKRKTDSNTISFNLDIRNAVSEKKSEQTYAGVDFKAIDCLELPDYKACRNLMVNPSFEQGMMFRDIHCAVYKPVWDSDVFSIDTENALFGKACLRIRSLDRSDDVVKTSEKDIPEAWRNQPGIVHRYIAYPRSLELTQIPLEPGTYTLSFYAKCDYPGKQKIAIGYGWESPTKEWKRYSGIIKEEKNRISFFQVEAFSDVKGGNIYIDGVQLEKGDKVTEFTEKPVSGMLLTSKPDNFLNCGDKVDARLKVMSQANASGKARVTAKDFYSENLFDKTFDFKCDKDGIAEIALPFEDKFPEGIFVVKADYTLDDGTRDYDFFRFSVMKFLENKHRLKNMFAYTLDGYNGMPNYPQILERYKRIGAGAISMETIWTKDLLDLYDKYGIDVLMFRMSDCGIPFLPVNGGVLFELSSGDRNGKVSLRDYRYNDPKAKLTEEYLRKYEDTVAKNAKDNPRVKAWKIDSELSAGGRYGMTREDFTKLQIAFYHGVKKGNPSAAVMQGGPCNMRPQGGIKDLEEELTLWSAVKYDLVGIHPYRNRPEDPDLDSDAAYLLNMLKKNNYDGTKVLWDEGMYYNQYHIPQLGYKCADWIFFTWVYGPLSYDMGWWEKISATWRARSWLVALKYQDRILTSTGGGEHNFSMDINLTPYASQKIPNTLGNLLGNAYFREDIRFAPYSRCYIFEDEQKRPVAAVWGYHAKLDDGTMPPFQASANFTGQTPEIFDLMGAGREAKADEKGNIAFPISSFPLFFRGKPGTLNTFVSTFRNAVLLSAEGLMPVEMYEEVATPDSMNVTIKNLVSKEYTGKLGVNDASYPFKIPPAEKSVISVKMPNVLK
ncbi:MAG: hypothetical protein NT118_08280, partial [Lentisphaerae bacterium]|nr:hypothetical protein [Lentisphaerota bacterium]